MKTDFLGNDLAIGDKIAFTEGGYKTCCLVRLLGLQRPQSR
ncbi:ribonucleotide reductase of class Ia (aerobic) alpha subunit [Salmonella phage 40]|nr:ribonucleotide reductase of class Ia (aerobic) alpha subunit [Salmonella phage 40]